MLLRKRKRVNSPDNTDTLSQLLAGEQRLATQLEIARQEASNILRDAEEYARRIEEGTAATIEERALAFAKTRERQLDEELAHIRDEASREVKRFEDIDDTRTRELVALVLRHIVEGVGRPEEKAG